MILGYTKDEGALALSPFMKDESDEYFEEFNEVFDVNGPILLMGLDEHSTTDEDSSTANLYRLHYLDADNATFSRQYWEQSRQMLTDLKYAYPVHSGLELFRIMSKKPIFYYRYGWV